jgi:Icc-related predicted phosphoesterase
MKIVCISDTHGGHGKVQVPDGDILVCAGDITPHGRLNSLESFDKWMGELPHRHKVVIAGNHDFCFQETPVEARAKMLNAHYLEDEAIEIEGLKIYGSPWQPVFCRMAFNLNPEEIRKRWAAIPVDTDLLITHGPPSGILDCTYDGRRVGCPELCRRLGELHVKLHVFGHIHEGYGQSVQNGTTFVNASICTPAMRPTNAPIVFELG